MVLKKLAKKGGYVPLMLISIGYMCLMLCAPLDWQYAELPSSASALCVYVRCGSSNQIIIKNNNNKKKAQKKQQA